MRFIRFIISLFTRAPVVDEHESCLRALAVLQEQRPYYKPDETTLPPVTQEYRQACGTFLRSTESALRFNTEDWLEAGNPHSAPIPVKEQTEEEAHGLFPNLHIDHHKIALSLIDA
jgi:hypothetical protein